MPVSKIPATDESLKLLDLSATSIHVDIAKHFLFSGTKIVRARRPQDDQDDEAVALAVVVRTGFNTTKGALVRSMLFPKPSGFKFYKDSFRYISVMAGVAGLAFVASFVNFVRLNVSGSNVHIASLLLTVEAGLASDYCACFGLDHNRGASSTAGNIDDRNQLCSV